MVAGGNFYLVSAGILPALVLVQSLERRIEVVAPSDRAIERFNLVQRDAARLGMLTLCFEAALYVLAEVVCLRALETGHAPIGNWIVWLALGESAFWPLSARIFGPEAARAFAEWTMKRLDSSESFGWLDSRQRSKPETPPDRDAD